jgi:peptidoglycan/LPS O-acetylase OafA/YrhL
MQSGGKRLEYVEFGRGCAALAVVISHGPAWVGNFPDSLIFLNSWGIYGVSFFFILSGFIIYHVHIGDIDRPDRAANFAWRRFIRIFPTYWLVLAVALCLNEFAGNPDYRIHLSGSFLADEFLLLPGKVPLIAVAWTLRHELLFYLIFLVAILNSRIGLCLFGLWLAIIVASVVQSGWSTDSERNAPWDILSHPLNLYFFMGMGIAAALRHNRLRIVALTSVTASVACFLAGLIFTSPVVSEMTPILIGVSAVVCAVLFSDLGIPSLPGAIWFGSISYSLYLVHMTSFQIEYGLARHLKFAEPGGLFNFALGVAITFMLAFFLANFYEKPLMAYARRLGRDGPARGATIPANL